MSESVADKYKVPSGLRPLLEAFARETLRSQPEDIYEFGKLFFDVLQIHRKQNRGTDVIEDQLGYDMFRSDLQQKFKAMKESEHSRSSSPQDVAAMKIQAAFRGHFVRNHPEKFGIDAADMTRRRSTERLNFKALDNKKDIKRHSVGGYSHIYSSPEDRAATKIQAEIRGFLTRRRTDAMKQKNGEAATKIQAQVRGFLTRKKLEEKGLMSPSRSHSRNSLQSTEFK